MNLLHRVYDTSRITRVRTKLTTILYHFIVVTISFMSHNRFLFLTWNVSYQTPCPTILFKSSHKRPMLESGRNETSRKFRKSIVCNFYDWRQRGLSVNCESGLSLPKLCVGVLPQGKKARTCTLILLPGITVYEIGTTEPNNTRCTLLCLRSTL